MCSASLHSLLRTAFGSRPAGQLSQSAAVAFFLLTLTHALIWHISCFLLFFLLFRIGQALDAITDIYISFEKNEI